MPLGTEVGLGPGDIVLVGDVATNPRKRVTAAPSHFSAHVYCGCQTDGWIKIPVGTEVGPGPGSIVLDGDPALTEKGTVPLCGFRHICTSGLIVGASRASFITVFAISCTRYRVCRPLGSRLTLNDARRRYFRFL